MDNKLQLFNFEGQGLAIKKINGEVYFNADLVKLPEVAMLSLVGIELTNICLHPQVGAK